MTPEELTPIVTAHQNVISRHDQEMAEIRIALKQANEQHNAAVLRIDEQIEATQKLARFNQEQLNTLAAGLVELRNLVAD